MLLQLALPLHLAATALAAAPPLPPPVAATTQVRPADEAAATVANGTADVPASGRPAPGAAVQDASAAPADEAAPRQAGTGRLATARGGTDTVANHLTLNGTVANNSAVNVLTGSNIIDAGSFANAAGIPMVVQNTGANVLIQNATIVNVQLH